jgi:hypothetical protein
MLLVHKTGHVVQRRGICTGTDAVVKDMQIVVFSAVDA